MSHRRQVKAQAIGTPTHARPHTARIASPRAPVAAAAAAAAAARLAPAPALLPPRAPAPDAELAGLAVRPARARVLVPAGGLAGAWAAVGAGARGPTRPARRRRPRCSLRPGRPGRARPPPRVAGRRVRRGRVLPRRRLRGLLRARSRARAHERLLLLQAARGRGHGRGRGAARAGRRRRRGRGRLRVRAPRRAARVRAGRAERHQRLALLREAAGQVRRQRRRRRRLRRERTKERRGRGRRWLLRRRRHARVLLLPRVWRAAGGRPHLLEGCRRRVGAPGQLRAPRLLRLLRLLLLVLQRCLLHRRLLHGRLLRQLRSVLLPRLHCRVLLRWVHCRGRRPVRRPALLRPLLRLHRLRHGRGGARGRCCCARMLQALRGRGRRRRRCRVHGGHERGVAAQDLRRRRHGGLHARRLRLRLRRTRPAAQLCEPAGCRLCSNAARARGPRTCLRRCAGAHRSRRSWVGGARCTHGRAASGRAARRARRPHRAQRRIAVLPRARACTMLARLDDRRAAGAARGARPAHRLSTAGAPCAQRSAAAAAAAAASAARLPHAAAARGRARCGGR